MENVLFTKSLTPDSLIKIYDALGMTLQGKVAVKLHSGEEGNQNYLKPEFVKSLVEHVNGTVVECNTAYDGARDTTEKHIKLMEKHGWSKYFTVDILDSEGEEVLENKKGTVIQKNIVGSKMKDYNSMLVLSHFKGHPMGGYGGAIKQLSIGMASSYGKAYIHGAGNAEGDYFATDQYKFLKVMADSASAELGFGTREYELIKID